MAQIINASIDLSKIDKSKINKFDKDGNPYKNGAQYYSVTIFVNDEVDKFGNNVSVANNQTKDEQTSGTKKTYIGNGKVVWTGESKKKSQPEQDFTPSATEDDGSLPF